MMRQRGNLRQRKGANDLFLPAVLHGDEQVVFVLEVEIDGAHSHACLFGDMGHRGILISDGSEQVLRRLYDRTSLIGVSASMAEGCLFGCCCLGHFLSVLAFFSCLPYTIRKYMNELHSV